MTENAKAVLNFAAEAIEIEGQQSFVAECVAKFPRQQAGADPSPQFLLEQAIRHAWDWFALHATQRMQGVNFFLIAAAFLTAAYVSAMQYGRPAVAIGVAALAFLFCVVFYLFEVRIRELIKTGEKALGQAQRKLAEMTGVQEFEICRLVERPRYQITSYHQVIRGLYFLTGATFVAGAAYALRSLSPPTVLSDYRQQLLLTGTRLVLIGAACLSFFWAQRLVLSFGAASRRLNWVVAVALAAAGAVVLVLSAVRLLR